VTYVLQNQWSSGFVAQVTIVNGGGALTSWAGTISYSPGQQVLGTWNASFTQVGTLVTFTNSSWNGAVAAGGSVTFGIYAQTTGTNPPPTSITFNGAVCS
jgi:cellulase/cellobiase CelA1